MPSDWLVLLLTGCALVLSVVAIVAALVVWVGWRRQRRAGGTSPLTRLTAALQAGDEQAAARELVDFLNAAHERLGHVEAAVALLRERAVRPLQNLGAVHFDAADDISGRLSCALAVLDAEDNGFILTSLYTRERCRTFVRDVTGGRTEHQLLPEEAEALARALGRKE